MVLFYSLRFGDTPWKGTVFHYVLSHKEELKQLCDEGRNLSKSVKEDRNIEFSTGAGVCREPNQRMRQKDPAEEHDPEFSTTFIKDVMDNPVSMGKTASKAVNELIEKIVSETKALLHIV